MKRKYFAVYSKLMQDPNAIFQSHSWATRFIEEQSKIWVNAKWTIEIVEDLRIRGKSIVTKRKWYQLWRMRG